MVNICWISLDPIRKEINYYPNYIAKKLEISYKNKYDKCILGSIYFNATIHFNEFNNHYQTTPSHLMGRCGLKPPGYRSVKRLEIEDINDPIEIKAYKFCSEWRIIREDEDINCLNQILLSRNMPSANPSYIFREIIPHVALFNNDSININEKVEYWKSEELESDIFDEKYVIVWQWCKKTAQEDKSIWRLNNKFWIPYLFDHNKLIEEEFQKNNKSAKISIPSCNFNKEIIFSEDSCFALQRDEITSKLRNVRRIILSIKDLKKILNNNNLIKISIDNFYNFEEENDEIPYEYICPISQSIMMDPVKTCDNHVYDRLNIEKWFHYKNTSPLTGLVLANTRLETNKELFLEIQEYIKSKIGSDK